MTTAATEREGRVIAFCVASAPSGEVRSRSSAVRKALESRAMTLGDDAGNCSVAKLAANALCKVGAECQSGACVAWEAGCRHS